MFSDDNNQAHLAHQLPYSAVLGFRDHPGIDGSRLLGLQIASLSRFAIPTHLIDALAAIVCMWLFSGAVATTWLLPWFLAAVLAAFLGLRINLRLSRENQDGNKAPSLLSALPSPIMSATLWAFALIYFSPQSTQFAHLTLWMLCVLLVVSSVLYFRFTPLGTLLFGLIVGLSASASFAFQEQYILACVSGLFVFVMQFGALELARANLGGRIAEFGVAEKDEVVSLLLREFEENGADWLWQVDTARRARLISTRFAFALDRSASEAEGMPLLELIAGDSWQSGQFPNSLHDFAELLKNKNSFSNQIVEVSISGEQRWWELSGMPMRDKRGNFIGFRGVGRDVTKQRESSEKIAYLARFDALTALPNRVQVNDALGEALRYAERWHTKCAFMMIDLDRFKGVNDSLGHLVGDKLLAQVSSRLQNIVGDGQLCGRLGGDEFAIVIHDANDEHLVDNVAKQVIQDLSAPYRVDSHTLYIGASVGSAVGPRDGGTVEELMRNADLALYRSKDEGGGGHYRFENYLNTSVDERRELESALQGALDRNELELHFQPVVSADSEQVVSFEALLRWNSAEYGLVSPDKFVPLAEETRMIVPMGRWVMHQACLEACNWPDHVKVAVNISPEQLLEPGFSEDVVKVLSETGLKPKRLEIEVTENVFLRDASMARAALEQIIALGCSVALDDFGTGYSSLRYLRKLRFSTIKVDHTFVQGAARKRPESIAVIRAVVAMAQSLDFTTTAEGVENATEVEVIRDLGCDKIQGYYYGRPMSARDARTIFSINDSECKRA